MIKYLITIFFLILGFSYFIIDKNENVGFYEWIDVILDEKYNLFIFFFIFFYFSIKLCLKLKTFIYNRLNENEELEISRLLKTYILEILFLFNLYSVNWSFSKQINKIIFSVFFIIFITIIKISLLISNLRVKKLKNNKRIFFFTLFKFFLLYWILKLFNLFKSNKNFIWFRYIFIKLIIECSIIFVLMYKNILENKYKINSYIIMILYEKVLSIFILLIDIFIIIFVYKHYEISLFLILNILIQVILLKNFIFNIYMIIKLKLNFDKSENIIFGKEDNVECIVCLDNITKGKILGCSHIFHKNCLFFWIINDEIKKCPICKKLINFNKKIKKLNFKENKKNMSMIHFNSSQNNNDFSSLMYLNYHIIRNKINSILN